MRIAILVFPGIQLLDAIGPLEVFVEAARQLGRRRAYEARLVSTVKGPIAGWSGPRLLPDRTIFDADEAIDTLLVAGGPRARKVAADPQVQAWLRRQASRARRYGSVCSGAFLLAAAGLLDGRQVTTHWNHAEELAADYPQLSINSDSIFICDGPVCTSAGVTAGMDLALALVEQDHGRDLALAVARELVMFLKRPGGQSQFSANLAAQIAEKTPIQQIQAWVLDHLTADLSVPALAKRAGMSERNFSRIFRDEAGTTPADFVEAARIDAARRLLEDSDIPLQRVATRSGFITVNNQRRAFLRRLGVTPADYRKRFRMPHAA